VSKWLNLSSNCLHCLVAHDSSFLRTKLFPLIPMGTYPTGALNATGKKVVISDQYLAIARKRLKIDGYMLLCVWPALNPLSTHVTFTMIVQEAYPREAKICKKCAKMANFWTYRLNYWETVEDILDTCCDAFDKHWILFSSMWHLPRLSQGRTQGRLKCALGWLKKLTHVPLAIAILLVNTHVSHFYYLITQYNQHFPTL